MIMENQLSILSKEMRLKKKPIPFPIRSIEEVRYVAGLYKKERAKKLFLWLYLSGQRVSEALKLTRFDVSLQTLKGKEYIVVNSMTAKNKAQPRRSIPIPMFGDEKDFSELVWGGIEKKTEDVPLFNVRRTNVWNLLSKVKLEEHMAIDPKTKQVIEIDMKIYPHFLRHCRASHLAMFYGYSLYRLMQYFGWSSPGVASVYASMNWESLAKPFEEHDI
jgi:site-specific recombinase XerD